jgi:hypothetical protein
MRGSGGIAPPFLTSALSGRFTHEEIAPSTNWIRGLVYTRDGLDAVEKRKILLLPEIEHRPSSS